MLESAALKLRLKQTQGKHGLTRTIIK